MRHFKKQFHTHRGTTWLWIIVILAIVVIVVALANTNTSAPTDDLLPENIDTETPASTIPAEWDEFSTDNFVISFPPRATTALEGPEDDIAEIQYTGPDQEPNTEITDGYRITIQKKTFEEVEVFDLEGALETEMSNHVTVTMEAQEVTFGVMSGYEYEAETDLGTINRYILLPAGPSSYLYISIFTSDEEVYGGDVSSILSSLTLR